jgi:hypothetical protein
VDILPQGFGCRENKGNVRVSGLAEWCGHADADSVPAKTTAKGSPTYPNPITATVALRFFNLEIKVLLVEVSIILKRSFPIALSGVHLLLAQALCPAEEPNGCDFHSGLMMSVYDTQNRLNCTG